jgi:pyruvate dehydrogenase E1 component alpha subunit
MLMAELFGRDAGYSQGKGGSMHLFDVEHAFYGGYGIVGGQIPLASGVAFAAKYRGEERVVVCSFGDAAANQGSFHETFNMAAKWKLPVLYVIENNKYGMGTDVSRVTAEPELHKRGDAYRMRHESVDGMDVLEVYDLVKELATWIRAGNGPVLLEANTYRFRGHSMSDAATYRTKDEVEREKGKDPIQTLRAHITKTKAQTDAQLDAIDEEVKKTVDEAIAFAEASPEPALETLWQHGLVEDGEPDVHPRERVLGATDVKWPEFPTRFEVKWDLEPRTSNHAHTPAATPVSKKGAA